VAARPAAGVLKTHLAEPAERPTMEEICDGLSDMYSIEVPTIPSM
jgi:hypothetical protein